MRKLAFIGKGLIFLILFYPQQFISAQGFGRTPLMECWRLENENITDFSVASDNAAGFFLGLSGGSVEAIDKNVGKPLWHSEIGGEIISPIVSDEKKLYVVSKNLNGESTAVADDKNADDKKNVKVHIRALSASTGITNWQKSFTVPDQEKIYLLTDSEKLFVLTETGHIYILNKQDGETLLSKKLDLRLSAVPFLLDGKLFLGTTEKKVVILTAENARTELEMELKNVPTAILSLSNTLFLGDGFGNVSALDVHRKGVHWKTWTGAQITNITKVSRGLLVSSFDNYVYLLSEKNGKRIWKKRLSGRSVGNPLIKDDVAVFSTLGGTDAVFIELIKGKSVNQISIQAENYFVHNPSGLDNLVVFQTFRGIFAFGSEPACKNSK